MTRPTTSFALNDHFRAFAERKVREGRYASTSEVVRAGLRLLEAEEEKLEALRRSIDEGENSGSPEAFDLDEFLAEMRNQH
jgi:antitoxin ParD1/3/4